MIRVAVISDTHWSRWDLAEAAGLISFLKGGYDAIWHAGDVVDESVLAGLERFAPVVCVKGNCDAFMGRALPHSVTETVGGVKIGMIHGWDLPLDHAPSVAGRFADDVDLIIHGHTHKRRRQSWKRPDGSVVTLLNPGSVSSPRGGETAGAGRLTVEGSAWSYEAVALR